MTKAQVFRSLDNEFLTDFETKSTYNQLYKEESYDPNSRKVFSRISLSIFTIGILTLVFQYLFMIIAMGLVMANVISNNSILQTFMLFVPNYVLAVPLGLLVMKNLPKIKKQKEKMSAKDFFSLLLMCFPLMYIGSYIGNIISNFISKGNAVNDLDNLLAEPTFVTSLLVAVVAPIFEELIFRKQIIDRCEVYGEKTAIVFSAICFGLFHMNFFQFFYAFATGLVFGYAYVRTHQLRYTVLMHMIINFIGGVITPYVVSVLDQNELIEEVVSDEMIGMSYYFILILAFFVVGLFILIKKRKSFIFKATPNQLPSEELIKTPYLNIGFALFTVLCGVMIYLSLRL